MKLLDLDELFDISKEQRAAIPRTTKLLPTYDTHIHCRPKKTGQMQMVVTECLKAHRGIVDIANVTGIETPRDVLARTTQILSCVPTCSTLDVQVVPLINDHSDPDMWCGAYRDGIIPGIKAFWYGVSNSYGQSITTADAIEPFVRATTKNLGNMQRPMLITLHAECLKDYDSKVIPIKDREYWCMQNEVRKMVTSNPEGRYVIRHVSDYRTLDIVNDLLAKGADIHVEFSPQYLMLIDDSIFTGDDGHAALQCDCIFWPRPKDAYSRTQLRKAALLGYDWFHIGQDYAMHIDDPTQLEGVKINSRGIASGGLNLLPEVAKSLMIDFFAANGKLEVYERLASINPAKLYGFTPPEQRETYERYTWSVPEYIYGKRQGENGQEGSAVKARCYLAGHAMNWKRAA